MLSSLFASIGLLLLPRRVRVTKVTYCIRQHLPIRRIWLFYCYCYNYQHQHQHNYNQNHRDHLYPSDLTLVTLFEAAVGTLSDRLYGRGISGSTQCAADLSVAVGRFGVLLRDTADDDLRRSDSVIDLREQLVASSHLSHVHPARVAGAAEVLSQQLHVRLMSPLVTEENRRRDRRLSVIVVYDVRYNHTHQHRFQTGLLQMRATPAGLQAGSIETKEPVARTSLNLSDVQGTGASILCRCHEFNIIVHKSLQPSYTLYSRILSHIPSSS